MGVAALPRRMPKQSVWSKRLSLPTPELRVGADCDYSHAMPMHRGGEGFSSGDRAGRQAEVRFAAEEINGRPRAVLAWDSAAVRFASLQAVAALEDTAVSGASEGTGSAAHNWGQSS
jgi:hypothetical protein